MDDMLDPFVDEAVDWITTNLGPAYLWPGNVRELEQCVRNLLLRREYRPADPHGGSDPDSDLVAGFRAGTFTAEELLNAYARIVYERTGTFEAAGRCLCMDRRTVKRRVLAARETGR